MSLEKREIKCGKCSVERMVKLFGTPAAKKRFKEKGRLTNSYINPMLNKAARECNIEEREDGYYITEVYDVPRPTNWRYMSSSLYKYLTPILLNKLIDKHIDENKPLTLTVGKWARELSLINDNYSIGKYNIDELCKQFGFKAWEVADFYERIDQKLHDLVMNTFKYLKKERCLVWQEVFHIIIEKSKENTFTTDYNGNVKLDIEYETRVATDEEIEYYNECVVIADEFAHITNEGERYYSEKSTIWANKLKKELYKRKIKGVFKAFKGYIQHEDLCRKCLSLYPDSNIDKLSSELADEFGKSIIENAEKRIESKSSKYSNKSYYSTYLGMTCLTILDDEDLGLKKKNLMEQFLTLSFKEGDIVDEIQQTAVASD